MQLPEAHMTPAELLQRRFQAVFWEHPKVCVNLQTDVR